MKKFIIFAFLVVAGIATASAGKWVSIQCPDGSVHSVYYEETKDKVTDDFDEAAFDKFCDDMLKLYCAPKKKN